MPTIRTEKREPKMEPDEETEKGKLVTGTPAKWDGWRAIGCFLLCWLE